MHRPGPGLGRVAKANGFSLHAGVSCEGHQKGSGNVRAAFRSAGTSPVPLLPPPVYPRVNLTRYHGILVRGGHPPNHRWRGEVTPSRRGKALKTGANAEVRTPAECHAAVTWAQRLKRVFNIDIEVCARCSGSVRVIVDASNRCIEDQGIIPNKAGQALDRILAHLRDKEQEAPARPLLVPPTRAPPAALSLFAGSEFPTPHQQGRH